ncbi:amino acid adenylation domain-containing protein [Paenibacillus cellulosilyticus]|uniref:Amino acid adenylation domain-containing protein n=1 Tax=Paenibacillus cellulosilyticus TaxID=375489 RepID=A0A2V2YT20_9BACL|nr:amino acid adenylation domain-containing protein [Paenibacillus cellulosilyticus]PWW00791.1 amino acid adenylation domain-containing protein [Paenibacillus cellulosilyticus]QKS45644.1 amino acid adenylation domain-containing protein [Paenibacillus cellulosilyticus]
MRNAATSIPQLFEEIVSCQPHSTAVLFDKNSMTYQELNDEADRVADKLIDIGVGPQQSIGVFMERSLQLISCILGIFKSRSVYVPISVEYPEERIKYILKDAGINVVITQENLAPLFRNIGGIVLLDINQICSYSSLSDSYSSPRMYDANDTAYILYTSGTTGNPKGVPIQHAGICNRLVWMKETYKLQPDEVLLHKAPIGFDVSVCEIFYPLTSGAVVAVAKPDINKNIRKLISEINDHRVTMVHFIPPLLDLFLDFLDPGDCESIRIIVCGGEKWSFSLGEKTLEKLNKAELYNGYGPTEASVGVGFWKFDGTYPDRFVPIGKPISNTRFYVLDSKLNKVGDGEIGELCISGVCLSSGYINKPDATKDKFVSNPHNHDNIPSYARLYRTGDLVRQLRDGNIVYVGRADGQVKLRGMRLELGEIENALLSNEAITGAVVLYHECNGKTFLSGHVVVSKLSSDVNVNQLQDYLRDRLPEFMIPGSITIHNRFPTTLNGKTDKEQLKRLVEK